KHLECFNSCNHLVRTDSPEEQKNLETLKGDEVVRPTAERVKEALFSAVQFHIPGAQTLDLFAGSGQLGIEALSRGAAMCVFIDQSRDACDVVKRNLKHTELYQNARVASSDALIYLKYCKDKFDIIFVDPPYKNGTVQNLLPELGRVCAQDGFVVCETERDADLPDTSNNLTLKKSYRYGHTRIWLYQNASIASQDEGDKS
ncbi:MAG: 16S rRNA (guanine(966)-N(2))-methyltransferase RsmD, partial [Oscillospiraceae bacterium]